MYWGHLGHFHRAISHLKWYKSVCLRYLASTFSQMKSINTFSMFLQSGVPRHFLWKFIAVWIYNLTVFMFMYANVDLKLQRQYAETWVFGMLSCCVRQGKYSLGLGNYYIFTIYTFKCMFLRVIHLNESVVTKRVLFSVGLKIQGGCQSWPVIGGKKLFLLHHQSFWKKLHDHDKTRSFTIGLVFVTNENVDNENWWYMHLGPSDCKPSVVENG